MKKVSSRRELEDMGFSEVVQWWDEWQLRVLVLCSLFLQYFLFVAAGMRKRCIPSWFRFFIWLAYLGSDALAIYALATLFNSHRKQEWTSTRRGSSSLEALWAPVLLVHLGGQDGITAYNIEDNELWRRHVLTAVSQVAVAIYVFCKSWPGDKKLLQTAIIFFICGIIRCLDKPWALKNASINSIVSSSSTDEDHGGTISLDEYIDQATKCVLHAKQRKKTSTSGDNKAIKEPYHLFEDLAYPYTVRLENLKYMVENKQDEAHGLVQSGLSKTFDRLYTKKQVYNVRKMASNVFRNHVHYSLDYLGGYLRSVTVVLTFAAIGVFHKSDREAQNSTDIWVTYTMLCCTAALQLLMTNGLVILFLHWCVRRLGLQPWPEQVAQYSLVGYLARNRRHPRLRKLATMLVCKDYLDKLWCMESCKSSSSRAITKLVHAHVKQGWRRCIKDTATYRAFNDKRGQGTLLREKCTELEWSLRRPFDESVLLWHLATDLCFYQRDVAGQGEDTSPQRRCSREISNYMVYLMFVNPEMLMTGTRRSLFRTTCHGVKHMLDDGDDKTPLEDREMMKKIIQQLEKGTQCPGIILEAWELSKSLVGLRDKKMWRVMQGVWVEMLCFSAGRCRGYLHAKNLGKGGEYLSYVWLLLSHMGMETLAERVQRTELPEEGDTGAAAPVRTSMVMPIGDDSV
ncbi:hypothetical protein CFC21_005147 [Triticum aestivum]|uniref:DUF4220 domain-containing protein n=2 Tax=Triticum aestivum TaxID=4565 RepID=A0A3B5YSJ5_WHEAT|nr:hypothetical protein CFC21_005147 [Triticum aestivum]